MYVCVFTYPYRVQASRSVIVYFLKFNFYYFMCLGVLSASSMHHVSAWYPQMPEQVLDPLEK